MSDGRIKMLCEGIYSICGKIICFATPDMFDVSDPKIQEDLIAFAEDLYSEGSFVPRLYGDKTVCAFRWLRNNTKYTCYPRHVDELKEPFRSLVKKELICGV